MLFTRYPRAEQITVKTKNQLFAFFIISHLNSLLFPLMP